MCIYIALLSRSDTIINIVSCLFTVLALVFTLYFWLLDHLSADEAKFIEKKKKYLARLKDCLEILKHSQKPTEILNVIRCVNDILEIILSYRFWANSSLKRDYNAIHEFYTDSRFIISTLQRSIESNNASKQNRSLAYIPELSGPEMEDIKSDYLNGLLYIINFIENWK